MTKGRALYGSKADCLGRPPVMSRSARTTRKGQEQICQVEVEAVENAWWEALNWSIRHTGSQTSQISPTCRGVCRALRAWLRDNKPQSFGRRSWVER